MLATPRTTDPRCPSSSIARAREAIAAGYLDAASVIARAAMEMHLRELCSRLGFGPFSQSRLPSSKDYARRLLHRHHIDRRTEQQILELTDVGNRAAHGHPVSLAEVASMVSGVECFIALNPLPQTLEETA